MTFSSSGSFFNSSGSVSSDYLYIGPGSTFEGNGYTMTFDSGCEPYGGIEGVFYCSSGTIQNVQFTIHSNVVMNTDCAFLLYVKHHFPEYYIYIGDSTKCLFEFFLCYQWFRLRTLYFFLECELYGDDNERLCLYPYWRC